MKQKYYTLDRILKTNADYYVIIGERSNGKTYATLKLLLTEYLQEGKEFGIIRRWTEDFRGNNARKMFDALIINGEVEKLSKGKYNTIEYVSMKWYLAYYDEEKQETIKSEFPFAYGFSINDSEHYKSTSYLGIKNIMFDEFIASKLYLTDEFKTYCNLLSTIIRDRDGFKIFMLGNTINKYSPYFVEMGLTNIKNMKPNELQIYTYNLDDNELRVAVEFTESISKHKKSNKYFAFDNPKLNVITGKGGAWELEIYPHLPYKYKPKEVIYIYYIKFYEDILQCNIINVDGNVFTYIHRKTTPIDETKTNRLVYQMEFDARQNYRRRINRPITQLEKKIVEQFQKDKVFYSTNEVGNIVANYLVWCKNN